MTDTSKDKRTGWLADLKAGDRVGARTQWTPRKQYRTGTVVRVTPTGQIVVKWAAEDYETRFTVRGTADDDYWCLIPVAEADAVLARRRLAYDIGARAIVLWTRFDTDSKTTAYLEALSAALSDMEARMAAFDAEHNPASTPTKE